MRLQLISPAVFPDVSINVLFNAAETDFVTRGSNGLYPKLWEDMVLAQQDWAEHIISIYPNAERDYREYMGSLLRLDRSWARFAPEPEAPKPFSEQRQEGTATISTRNYSFGKVLAASFAITDARQAGFQKAVRTELIPASLTLQEINVIKILAWLEINPSDINKTWEKFDVTDDMLVEKPDQGEDTFAYNIAVGLLRATHRFLESRAENLRIVRGIRQMLRDETPEN